MAQNVPVDCANGPLALPQAVCRAHLEKVTQSFSFGRANQLRRCLKWLGERALEDLPVVPTEKEIGVSLLGRPDFDPQTDSIVRKEMARLRERLVKYYAGEGAKDAVRICLEGSYLPTFERRSGQPPAGLKACWLVLPFRSRSELLHEAEYLMEELLVCLGEPGGPDLISSTTALGYRDRAGDVRQFAAECGADLVVEGSLRLHGTSVYATAWVVDGQNGLVRAFKRISGSGASDLANGLGEWLLTQLTLPA